jgi:hypothetical protein
VKQNLTLTIDAVLLKAARRYALEHDTTVNQMVREHLARTVAGEQERGSVAELERILRASKYKIGKRTWTREDLHERG